MNPAPLEQLKFNSVNVLSRDCDPIVAMRQVFDLCADLIKCEDYHSLTINVLTIVKKFSNVIDVKSYEVFETRARNGSDIKREKNRIFRRFPLSFQAAEPNDSIHTANKILDNLEGNTKNFECGGKNYLLLDVKEVVPRRIILIEGMLGDKQKCLIEGLHSVYSSQTYLLDKKERDPLTHLLNRHSLDRIVNQVIDYYRSDKTQVQVDTNKRSWLAVVDVDHFKKINDTYGHLFGDEVLVHMANIMRNNFRFSDFIFRFGGEEFLILINDTDDKGACVSLERLRKVVEAYAFPGGSVTVSIGFACLDIKKSLSTLLEEADRAVYCAKNNGRNQVVFDQESGAPAADKRKGDIELF